MADLRTLDELPSKDSGGALYPMLQTILGGMELVGMLLSGKASSSAQKAFLKEFLKDHPHYAKIGDLFSLIRNGTAHIYLVRGEIGVTKGGINNLTRTPDGKVNIDVRQLLADFRLTYDRIKKSAELKVMKMHGVE